MASKNKLWDFFININEWQRYAEQKNVHMLAFITIQIGILGFISKDVPKLIESKLTIFGLIGLGVSFFLSACSLLPYTKWGEFRFQKLLFFLPFIYEVPKGSPSEDDLILVHEDIVKYKPDQFRKKLKSYFLVDNNNDQYFQLISDMILINARIWNIKFRFFTYALFINFFGFILSLIGLLKH